MKANARCTLDEIVTPTWGFFSDASGHLANEQITAAASMDAAVHLRRLSLTMQRIERLLLNLGDDGIHALIRYEAARVRKAERVKRQRAAAKRKRTIAAKKAAGL
jgi:hypothetical protein